MKGRIEIINYIGGSVSISVSDHDGIFTVTVGRPEDKTELSALCPGDIFRAGDAEYTVLEQFENGTAAVIRKEALEDDMIFDTDSNDWKVCGIRRFLNSGYLDGLTEVFGFGSIASYITDIMSLDGLSDYGKSVDRISLLDIEQYRRYRKYLGAPLDRPWWLVTPDSTPSGFPGNSMLYVWTAGDIGFQPCDFISAVRPFFMLRSDVYVSLVKQYEVDLWE